MYGFSAVVVLQAALLANTASDYQKAYDKAEAAAKPLLVLVGTEQSPAWRTLKEKTLRDLSRSGGLKEVVFVEVESQDNPKLTRQLLRGESLPQLVLYTPVGKLWRRTHIAGARSEDEVRDFLKREIAQGKLVARQAKQQKTTVMDNPSDTFYSFSSGSS
jgi:hypothetical protein